MPHTKGSTRDIDTLIGARVRSLRKEQGFTLKGLSEKLGISFVYLGQMERGEAPWKISMLSDVAGLLNAPLPFLLDPNVPLDRLHRVSEVLERIVELSEDRFVVVEHLLNVFWEDLTMHLIGNRIRALRLNKGWTLVDLSEKAGISAGYLSFMERGERGLSLDTLEKIADVFEVSPSLLQDPSVQIEQLTEMAEILSRLTKLTKEQLHAIRQMIDVFGGG